MSFTRKCFGVFLALLLHTSFPRLMSNCESCQRAEQAFSLINSAGLCPAINYFFQLICLKINPRIGNYGEFQFWECSFDTVACTGTIPVTVPSCTVVLYLRTSRRDQPERFSCLQTIPEIP